MTSSSSKSETSMFEIVRSRVESKPDIPLCRIRDRPNQPFSALVCLGCGKMQSSSKTPFSSCARCNAVKYCSRECQLADWKGKGNGPTKPRKHKDLCPELTQAMREFASHPTAGEVLRARVFADWADQHGTEGTFHLHEFLARRRLLGQTEKGYWAIPDVLTPYHTAGPDRHGFQNGQMLLQEQFPTLEEGWTQSLNPSQRIDVTKPPANALTQRGLQSWQEYLEWRDLSPSSVAPLLMTNVLTIYQMIQHELQLPALPTKSFQIYVLAVEAELNQIPLLQELLYLLPGLDLELVLLSPAAKDLCDQKRNHPNCLLAQNDCVLDVQHDKSRLRVKIDPDYGLYEDVPFTVEPTAVLGLNAGLASYQTWGPAMHKLLRQGTPFCFSDQTKLVHRFVQTQWLPNVVHALNRAFSQYEPLEVPASLEITLNPFHGIVGRDVAFVLAPNLCNGYLLTGFPE